MALIDRSADINAEDDQQHTSFKYACDKGHTELVDYLVEKGAERSFTSMFRPEPDI